MLENDLGELEKRVFGGLWKSLAFSKVVAFSWKMLLDRIPTRNNLWKRHAIAPEASRECAFCGNDEESSIHLFLYFYVVAQVWDKILR